MNDTCDPAHDPSGVAICIPARNEEARLPALFEAIDALDRGARTVHLCLLLDGCTDGSRDRVAAHAAASAIPVHVAEAPAAAPNAGLARHRAMLLGLDALGDAGGILLSTDADSRPARDWIDAMLRGLAHADIVAGDVVRDPVPACAAQDRIDAYYRGLYALRRRIDPVQWEAANAHHHGSGANMGMSAALYRQTGGFPPVPAGEDARFVDDASRAGLRVRRDRASVVVTSNRRVGRATGGLAEKLRDLDRDGLDGIVVAHPVDAAWQYRRHAMARSAFDAGRFDDLVPHFGLDRDHLTGVARDCPNGEAFAMRVVPVPPGGMRDVPFLMAEAALSRLRDGLDPAEAA